MNLLRNLGLLSLFALLGCSNNIEVNIPEEAKSIGTYKVTLTEFIRNDKGLVTEEIYTTQLYESNKVVETLEARRIHFEYDANDSLVEETYYTGTEKQIRIKRVTHKIGAKEKITSIFDRFDTLNRRISYTYNDLRELSKKENLYFVDKEESLFVDSVIYDDQRRPYLQISYTNDSSFGRIQTDQYTNYDSLGNVDYYVIIESGKEPDTINLINKFDGNILISTTVIDEYGDTSFVRNFKNDLISSSFLYKFYDTEKSEFDSSGKLIRFEVISEDKKEITVYQYSENFNAKISYELNIN
tara:strand:- start:66058 stop:66954 length:897 start_codon:yes stop_codon:yes gene_type:complete